MVLSKLLPFRLQHVLNLQLGLCRSALPSVSNYSNGFATVALAAASLLSGCREAGGETGFQSYFGWVVGTALAALMLPWFRRYSYDIRNHIWPVVSHGDRPIPLGLALLDTDASSDLLHLQTVPQVSLVSAPFSTIIVRRNQPLSRNFPGPSLCESWPCSRHTRPRPAPWGQAASSFPHPVSNYPRYKRGGPLQSD